MFTVFKIPNLSTSAVTKGIAPWSPDCPEMKLEIEPYTNAESKQRFKVLCADKDTVDLFFSMNEGCIASQRISNTAKEKNEIRLCHGIVLDFDFHGQTLEWALGQLARVPDEAKPNRLGLTFSNGFRMVWFLKEPLLIPSNIVYKAFISSFVQRFGVNDIMPGLDDKSFNSNMFFHRGRSWVAIHDNPVREGLIATLLVNASDSVKWPQESTANLIPAIAKLINEKFPGRWAGEFVEGARGVRFWDAAASNPTAAIVRKDGMQCFTGTEPFVSWRSIFGSSVIDRLSDDVVGQVYTDFWYDGKTYYQRLSDQTLSKLFKVDDFKRILKQYYHISKANLEAVQTRVEVANRINYAAPLHFQKEGVVVMQSGAKVLNTSTLPLLRPSYEGNLSWGQNFPKLAEYLDQLFGASQDSRKQLEHFLAFLSIFYKASFNKKPVKGQVAFFAGPPGCGKSYLVGKVFGDIFGGTTSVGSYFIDDDQFNAGIFNNDVWLLDDEVGSPSKNTMSRYSNLIKQTASNRQLKYRDMYSVAGNVDFFGRLLVTLNQDFKSMEVLPDMDVNLRDKINLYQCFATTISFPELSIRMEEELPFFCKYLLEFKIPEELQDDRFGIKSFHQDSFKRISNVGTRKMVFREFTQSLLRKLFLDRNEEFVILRVTEIFQFASKDDDLKDILRSSEFRTASQLNRGLLTEDTKVSQIIQVINNLNDQYFILINPNADQEALPRIVSEAKREIPDYDTSN